MTIFTTTLYWLFTIKTTAYSGCINKNGDHKKLLNRMYIMFTETDIGSRYHFYLPNKEQSKNVQNWEAKNQTSGEAPYNQYHMINTDP